ncbi:hypothetical protein OIU74_005917 [Salix koriyanagi]|uniref:Transmembrane protein n=1 Tax=Salix koriyanagi TaxID=2511006 RepID=A0A9Q0UD52_9ROSI|nr:hypothetical protein OIU74_005917 [Salix koriyanagi]
MGWLVVCVWKGRWLDFVLLMSCQIMSGRKYNGGGVMAGGGGGGGRGWWMVVAKEKNNGNGVLQSKGLCVKAYRFGVVFRSNRGSYGINSFNCSG